LYYIELLTAALVFYELLFLLEISKFCPRTFLNSPVGDRLTSAMSSTSTVEPRTIGSVMCLYVVCVYSLSSYVSIYYSLQVKVFSSCFFKLRFYALSLVSWILLCNWWIKSCWLFNACLYSWTYFFKISFSSYVLLNSLMDGVWQWWCLFLGYEWLFLFKEDDLLSLS